MTWIQRGTFTWPLDLRVRRPVGIRVIRLQIMADWWSQILGLKMKWSPANDDCSPTLNVFVYVGPFTFLFWTFKSYTAVWIEPDADQDDDLEDWG